MTQIEVPDWVLEAALLASFRVACEHTGTAFSEDEFRNARDEHDRENRNVASDMMRAALTAALGAWVVPAGYRVSIPSEPELGHWLEDIGEVTHPDPETHTTLYVLRQEKPE